MRWYLGYTVLAAGLVFGAQTLFPRDLDELALPPSSLGQTHDQNPKAEPTAAVRALARNADVIAPTPEAANVISASDVQPLPRSRLAAFSPGVRLLDAELPPSAPGMFAFIARSFGAAAPRPAVADTAPVEPAAASWKSAVFQVKADAGGKSKPADTAQKTMLARDVQRELQRVGCYLGEIDGIWGPGSQRAVTAFMERVNAILPVDEPDVFMLSLLATESDAVCGTTCPHGQVLSAGGRCLPTTLLAHDDGLEPRLTRGPALAARPSRDALEPGGIQDPETGDVWEATTVAVAAPANRPPPLHGRMGIGGPMPPDELSPPARTQTATLPISANRLHRSASLEPSLTLDVVDDVQGAAILPVAHVVSEPRMAEPIVTPRRQARERAAERPRAVKSSRKNWRSNYRQVQRLFEHPLGRM